MNTHLKTGGSRGIELASIRPRASQKSLMSMTLVNVLDQLLDLNSGAILVVFHRATIEPPHGIFEIASSWIPTQTYAPEKAPKCLKN